jgi:hypothetical protein
MQFEKGNKTGKAGRPPGSKNKKSKEIEGMFKAFIIEEWEEFKADFEKHHPTTRAKLLLALAEFVVPKKAAIKTETEYDKLSDEDLQRMVDQLKEKVVQTSKLKAVK